MKKSNHPILIAAASLFAIALPQSAFAQDTDNIFTGPSLGVQGGYERQTIDEPVLSGTDTATIDARESGIIYGGYAGYDQQFGEFVVGVEAGFSPNGRTITGDLADGGSIELNPKWSANASVRAGVVIADRALVYGRAGYARSRYSINRFANGNDTATVSENETRDGLMFGGGIEFAFNEYAALRVEYRRNKLDDTLRSNQVLAGATLRF